MKKLGKVTKRYFKDLIEYGERKDSYILRYRLRYLRHLCSSYLPLVFSDVKKDNIYVYDFKKDIFLDYTDEEILKYLRIDNIKKILKGDII